MFHNTIPGSKDGEKNFLYGRLIKIIVDNFLNKLRSEFGQEDDLTENQRQIHEYKGNKFLAFGVHVSSPKYFKTTVRGKIFQFKLRMAYF